LPLPLLRQIPRKALSLTEKLKNLESCLRKIKSHDKTPKEAKKSKELGESAKPNQETNVNSTKPEPQTAVQKVKEEVKEKRKPGRPRKKQLAIMP
jgi:hypothetical protein